MHKNCDVTVRCRPGLTTVVMVQATDAVAKRTFMEGDDHAEDDPVISLVA